MFYIFFCSVNTFKTEIIFKILFYSISLYNITYYLFVYCEYLGKILFIFNFGLYLKMLKSTHFSNIDMSKTN